MKWLLHHSCAHTGCSLHTLSPVTPPTPTEVTPNHLEMLPTHTNGSHSQTTLQRSQYHACNPFHAEFVLLHAAASTEGTGGGAAKEGRGGGPVHTPLGGNSAIGVVEATAATVTVNAATAQPNGPASKQNTTITNAGRAAAATAQAAIAQAATAQASPPPAPFVRRASVFLPLLCGSLEGVAPQQRTPLLLQLAHICLVWLQQVGLRRMC